MQDFHFPKCISCVGGASSHSPPNQFSNITFNVHHRGVFKRLCAACVLKYHITHFCPICYQVYDDKNPLPAILRRVMCSSCTAIAHSSCLTPANTCKSAPFRCPRCENCNPDDKIVAKQLMAAALIAAATVMKAEKAAKAMAEKRVEEALISKKLAVEAMEEFLNKSNNNNLP